MVSLLCSGKLGSLTRTQVGGLKLTEKNKPAISKLPILGIDVVTCAHIGNTLGDKYVYGYNYLLIDGPENDLAVWRVDMTQPDGGLVRAWSASGWAL